MTTPRAREGMGLAWERDSSFEKEGRKWTSREPKQHAVCSCSKDAHLAGWHRATESWSKAWSPSVAWHLLLCPLQFTQGHRQSLLSMQPDLYLRKAYPLSHFMNTWSTSDTHGQLLPIYCLNFMTSISVSGQMSQSTILLLSLMDTPWPIPSSHQGTWCPVSFLSTSCSDSRLDLS